MSTKKNQKKTRSGRSTPKSKIHGRTHESVLNTASYEAGIEEGKRQMSRQLIQERGRTAVGAASVLGEEQLDSLLVGTPAKDLEKATGLTLNEHRTLTQTLQDLQNYIINTSGIVRSFEEHLEPLLPNSVGSKVESVSLGAPDTESPVVKLVMEMICLVDENNSRLVRLRDRVAL